MEKIVEQGLLYDFYGELLTAHQRKIYEDAVYNDMSLSEIAQEAGITRQGVHDLIRRCDKILQGYEDTLHLLAKFTAAKERVAAIRRLSGETEAAEEELRQNLKQIETIAAELLEEL